MVSFILILQETWVIKVLWRQITVLLLPCRGLYCYWFGETQQPICQATEDGLQLSIGPKLITPTCLPVVSWWYIKETTKQRKQEYACCGGEAWGTEGGTGRVCGASTCFPKKWHRQPAFSTALILAYRSANCRERINNNETNIRSSLRASVGGLSLKLWWRMIVQSICTLGLHSEISQGFMPFTGSSHSAHLWTGRGAWTWHPVVCERPWLLT